MAKAVDRYISKTNDVAVLQGNEQDGLKQPLHIRGKPGRFSDIVRCLEVRKFDGVLVEKSTHCATHEAQLPQSG